MADKISDNVGKKIVEALKMQTQGTEHADISPEDSLMDSDFQPESPAYSEPASDSEVSVNNVNLGFSAADQSFFSSDADIDSAFQNSLNQNLPKSKFSQPQIDYELPSNVAILNRLIAKLPVGVSKQTGALIISQTMEALGISMNSVIQEAKEVQDSLTNSARECQKAIIDHRKQISELELKAQQYQKQAVMMNDVINLFNHA